MRMLPMEVAEQFVQLYFPQCSLAVLGGSAGTGRYGDHSDIDIVILQQGHNDFYRKVFRLFDWIVECICLSPENYRDCFDEGILAANPTLQRIVAEGIVLRCDELGRLIREEAITDLSYGPMPWSPSEIDYARYMISDLLTDVIGSDHRSEKWFIANKLTYLICEFILRTSRRWMGEGKHLYRMLAAFSPDLAASLDKSLKTLYSEDDVTLLIQFCQAALEPYGGILMEGYEE